MFFLWIKFHWEKEWKQKRWRNVFKLHILEDIWGNQEVSRKEEWEKASNKQKIELGETH